MTNTTAATRVLYMEDDPGLAVLMRKRLARKGYRVDVAADGESGLRMVAEHDYALVLVDYDMPGLCGLDVLRELARRGALPVTIMVTGHGDERVAVEAMKLGAADYVIKDSDLNYLELLPSVIEQALDRQRLVREREAMLVTIRENEERYRHVVELTPNGVLVTVEGRIVFINPAGARLLGSDGGASLVGVPLVDVIHPRHRETFREQLNAITRGRDTPPWVEGQFQRGNGLPLEVEFAGISFSYQGQWAVLLIFRDIAERKLAQRQLEHLAHYDALTDLPNRSLFQERLDQALLHAQREGQRIAVLFVDLDRFKEVNDSRGHDIGDRLLQETAERLKEVVRGCDTVARMGGDEFTVILSRIGEPAHAGSVAEKIIDSLSRPFQLGGASCQISASVGISLYPEHGDSATELVKKADAAMYEAKKDGRGRAQFHGGRAEFTATSGTRSQDPTV